MPSIPSHSRTTRTSRARPPSVVQRRRRCCSRPSAVAIDAMSSSSSWSGGFAVTRYDRRLAVSFGVNLVLAARGLGGAVAQLGQVDEARRLQDRPRHEVEPVGVGPALGGDAAVESEQRIDVVGGDGTPVGLGGERLDEGARAGLASADGVVARREEGDLTDLARRRHDLLGDGIELTGQHRRDDLCVVDGEAELLGGIAGKGGHRRVGVDAQEREHRGRVLGVGQAANTRGKQRVVGRHAARRATAVARDGGPPPSGHRCWRRGLPTQPPRGGPRMQ